MDHDGLSPRCGCTALPLMPQGRGGVLRTFRAMQDFLCGAQKFLDLAIDLLSLERIREGTCNGDCHGDRTRIVKCHHLSRAVPLSRACRADCRPHSSRRLEGRARRAPRPAVVAARCRAAAATGRAERQRITALLNRTDRVRPVSVSGPASRRDNRRSRDRSCGPAIRPRHISPEADRGGTWNRPARHAAPA